MTDETDLDDPILAMMERKHAFHLQAAAKLARDIAEYKRIRAENSDENLIGPAPAATVAKPPPVVTHPPIQDQPANPDPTSPVAEVAPPKQASVPVWRYETFDGTFSGLVRRYRIEAGSPYFKLHWKVRKDYDVTINKLMLQIGHERIADLSSSSRIQSLYEGWKEGGKVSTAHSYVAKVRLLASFGMTALNDDACAKLSILLSKMTFELPPKRTERLTSEQAIAIRVKAHEMGRSSLALAQALQFDLKLKQVEVIGEWVPVDESADAQADELIWNNEKWVRGLRWSAIQDGFMQWPIDWRQPEGDKHSVEIKTLPMVKEELELLNSSSRTGAMVICEWTGKPWKHNEFRRWWRKVADAAGVPKEVRNMDNRAEPIVTGRVEESIARASKEYLQ
ncbi:hypothetical protein ACVWZZ_004026 [Bradyrhizobium sp. LM6.10]|jgi:hypothetical protein